MAAQSHTLNVSKLGAASAAVLIGLSTLAPAVEARPGGGGNFGSRGAKTYSAPPPTATAPRSAAPVERSMTPQPGRPSAAQAAPAAGAQAAQQASRSGSMVRNLLLGGLIGAGLATLFGAGMLANVMGFLLQGLLIGGLIWLAFAFFARRRMGAAATPAPGAVGRMPPQSAAYRQAEMPAGHTAGRGPAAGAASASAGATGALAVGPDDFDAFERLLGEIQAAYGRADINTLGDRATPEMLSYFAADIDANAKKGLRNEITDVKLLQGDLAEAWSEASGEYATVAMRYALRDRMIETATGRPVAGGTDEIGEATELWTFRRPHRGTAKQWELSAIQQAA